MIKYNNNCGNSIVLFCIELVMSTIYTDTNTGGLCRFWYKWIYSFLASVLGDMGGETPFLKAYTNHTMLIPPPMHSASCGVWDLNSSLPVEIWKTQPYVSRAGNSSTCLFKILNFIGPSLLGMMSSILQPHILSGGLLLWLMMIVISFLHRHQTASSNYAPGQRDLSSSKPYQTK